MIVAPLALMAQMKDERINSLVYVKELKWAYEFPTTEC